MKNFVNGCAPVHRIRITKAAEFFKAVIPRMDPSMDKATAFQWTVYYMVFLRNALLKQDPPILPKLHQVCKGSTVRVWCKVPATPSSYFLSPPPPPLLPFPGPGRRDACVKGR